MTKAEKLMDLDPLQITLKIQKDKPDSKQEEAYVAEFKPGFSNPLQIKDINYDDEDPYSGSAIYISYESAVELAKFLKDLFLDEAPAD